MGNQGNSDSNGSESLRERFHRTEWAPAIVAVAMGIVIGAIVGAASAPLGLTPITFLIGFGSSTYFLARKPTPYDAIVTGLYTVAVLLAISPLLYFMPQVTSLGGYPTEGESLGGFFAVNLSGVAAAIIAIFVFALGRTLRQSDRHSGASNQVDEAVSEAGDGRTATAPMVFTAILMGLLNGAIARYAADNLHQIISRYDPHLYSTLRQSVMGMGVLDRADLGIPVAVVSLVFVVVTGYVVRKANPRTGIGAGLYCAAGLLVLAPILLYLIPNPGEFAESVPAFIVGSIIAGHGFFAIAAVLFFIGYHLKRPVAGPESG